MKTPQPRREFLAKIGASAAVFGTLCPLLSAQSASPSTPAAAPKKESDELARLRKQLDSQRDGSIRLLIELRNKHGAAIVDSITAFTVAANRKRYSNRKIEGKRDLQAVKAELWDKLPPDFVWELLEQSPERLRFKVKQCPIATRMKPYDAPDLGYALSCSSDLGIAAGINPDIVFSRTKTLMQGHDCCDHCYELRA